MDTENNNAYTLVIAEKPSVAGQIAEVLGAKQREGGFRKGNGYIVSWCIGHLVEPQPPESYDEAWKTWSYENLPICPKEWKYKVKGETRAQFELLCHLLNDSEIGEVICATDAGREGELIFRLVYDMAECKKPVKRLWISSMEEGAIRDGFLHLKAGGEYENLYRSALCRQKADWLVGMNGTRLFTSLYHGMLLKVGRVQTPTLAMLVKREDEIAGFVKQVHYVTHIVCDGDWNISGNHNFKANEAFCLEAVSEQMKQKEQAEHMADMCKNAQAVVTLVQKEEKKIAPPKLYDLTSLQRDANRLFSFTAKQTLEYAQSLYEKKLLTYPRTDSRYLSDDMQETAEKVIGILVSHMPFVPSVLFSPNIKRVLDSRKVTDHHAIIPTMEIGKTDLFAVPEPERKILFLVAERLLSATAESYRYESTKAELFCEEYLFTVSGKMVLQHGWKLFENAFLKFYEIARNKKESVSEESSLSKLKEGMVLTVSNTKVTEHFSSPPKRYTEDSLLSAMERAGNEDMQENVERRGLGTPATRADVIEKLVKDGYIKREKKQLFPTEQGIKLIRVLPDIVKSPRLTADWENKLTLVAKGELSESVFMSGIIAMIDDMIAENREAKEEYKKLFLPKGKILGICPNCKAEILKGKYGAYCDKKCGMQLSGYFGNAFTDEQVKNLLQGKKILLKGLIGKNGKTYDMYLEPQGIETYIYEKNGQTTEGYRFVYKKSYPKK